MRAKAVAEKHMPGHENRRLHEQKRRGISVTAAVLITKYVPGGEGVLPELVELQPAGVVAVVAPEEFAPVLPPRHLQHAAHIESLCMRLPRHGDSIKPIISPRAPGRQLTPPYHEAPNLERT
jgi:hypothetical protein